MENINEYKAIIEGLLFVSGSDGLTAKQIAETLEVDLETVHHILMELKYDYDSTYRGIQLLETEKYYYLTSKPEHTPFLKRMMKTTQHTKLSQASLEALAIIAYNQPITRAEVEDLRGVKSDRPIQTLISRGLIEESGRKEAPGRPMLFKTTIDFLTYFGLKSLEELPPLTEDFADQDLTEEFKLFNDQSQ
ncbi:segregation and condensation protein B [Pelagirhabdus alkalitolerans]|uniref:Segregation and condensation protein B n=1 Tax=Pelagirhabdus alkalitolerans TaxID=1612202 RepID=A0A1G6HC50_9BACI|nr:SMC-Scp complex subunit ScpB [Pelagirhabdus alkalitolerans]SDB91668.1 segregation and condensation protein B [Pelagirhabdus alkalitolerans]